MQAARRNLLKTGLMCTGAAAAAGVSLPASAAVEPKSKIAREEWDVVVVGAGFAGLCAALEAKEKGAKVLLIEKMGRPDCTSAYSSGWIAATKTRYQDKDDDDSKELYFKEMMEVSGGRSDPALIRAYAEIAGESVDWLGDHGMTYKIWKQHAPERMRCHIVPAVNGLTGGAHMVKVMLEALEKAGVPVRYNTKAVELVTDECFNVLGVSCIEKHRRVELMTKGGVILATGGFAGATVMMAIRLGVARGLFSNESGLGSAPIAAAAARTSQPVVQALISMTQTFIDTLVVCSMTGLVILVTGVWTSGKNGAPLTSYAFETGLPGELGGLIVTIGIILFAYSTILGWSYYGEKAIEYLLGSKAIIPYRWAFIISVGLGASMKLDLVWTLSDIFNALMAFPNLIGLIMLTPVVKAETLAYLRSLKKEPASEG